MKTASILNLLTLDLVLFILEHCLSVLWILSVMNVDLPSMNLCKYLYSTGKYNIINPYQLRATSFVRLLFTVKNRTYLLSPSFLFFPFPPSLSSFFPSFVLFGEDANILLKGDPISSTSPFFHLSRKFVLNLFYLSLWLYVIPFLAFDFLHC